MSGLILFSKPNNRANATMSELPTARCIGTQ
jgi:hypothetical protein